MPWRSTGLSARSFAIFLTATARPIGQAGHCPSIPWHLISYIGIRILLFRLKPSVSHNNCLRSFETDSFRQIMLPGQNVQWTVEGTYKIERTYTARARFKKCFSVCFFEPFPLATPGQNSVCPSLVCQMQLCDVFLVSIAYHVFVGLAKLLTWWLRQRWSGCARRNQSRLVFFRFRIHNYLPYIQT